MVYTTYKNGDDWGMVQMALFYPREFRISISSSFPYWGPLFHGTWKKQDNVITNNIFGLLQPSINITVAFNISHVDLSENSVNRKQHVLNLSLFLVQQQLTFYSMSCLRTHLTSSNCSYNHHKLNSQLHVQTNSHIILLAIYPSIPTTSKNKVKRCRPSKAMTLLKDTH